MKRHEKLRDFFEEHGVIWLSTRELIELGFKKEYLYDLKKEGLLNHQQFTNSFANYYKLKRVGSDRISGYWKISQEGLQFLQEHFGCDVVKYYIDIISGSETHDKETQDSHEARSYWSRV